MCRGLFFFSSRAFLPSMVDSRDEGWDHRIKIS
jgi:hypothetical protein